MTEPTTAAERRNQLWADFIDTVRGAPDPIRALKLRDAIEAEARATAEAEVRAVLADEPRLESALPIAPAGAKAYSEGWNRLRRDIEAILAATKDTE